MNKTLHDLTEQQARELSGPDGPLAMGWCRTCDKSHHHCRCARPDWCTRWDGKLVPLPGQPGGPAGCPHPNWLPPVDPGGTSVCERCGLERPGAPPAGLTVERLAMLLEEGLAVPKEGEIHGAPWLAAWLLPRLAFVSPGAPPAARRAPTDAMIDAAARALWETGNARIGFRAYTAALKQTYEREAEVALRAALAAQENPS